MDQILKIIAGWLGNISSSIPYIKAAVLQVTSMNCLYNVLWGGICFAICLILLGVGLFYLNKCTKWATVRNGENSEHRALKPNDYGYKTFLDTPICMAFFTSVALSIEFLVLALISLTDFWQWTCIYHPDLYLVHLAAQKVLN